MRGRYVLRLYYGLIGYSGQRLFLLRRKFILVDYFLFPLSVHASLELLRRDRVLPPDFGLDDGEAALPAGELSAPFETYSLLEVAVVELSGSWGTRWDLGRVEMWVGSREARRASRWASA